MRAYGPANVGSSPKREVFQQHLPQADILTVSQSGFENERFACLSHSQGLLNFGRVLASHARTFFQTYHLPYRKMTLGI
jgi:hypothetical protein